MFLSFPHGCLMADLLQTGSVPRLRLVGTYVNGETGMPTMCRRQTGPSFRDRITMLDIDNDFCPLFADGGTGAQSFAAIQKMQSHINLGYRKIPVLEIALIMAIFL